MGYVSTDVITEVMANNNDDDNAKVIKDIIERHLRKNCAIFAQRTQEDQLCIIQGYAEQLCEAISHIDECNGDTADYVDALQAESQKIVLLQNLDWAEALLAEGKQMHQKSARNARFSALEEEFLAEKSQKDAAASKSPKNKRKASDALDPPENKEEKGLAGKPNENMFEFFGISPERIAEIEKWSPEIQAIYNDLQQAFAFLMEFMSSKVANASSKDKDKGKGKGKQRSCAAHITLLHTTDTGEKFT